MIGKSGTFAVWIDLIGYSASAACSCTSCVAFNLEPDLVSLTVEELSGIKRRKRKA